MNELLSFWYKFMATSVVIGFIGIIGVAILDQAEKLIMKIVAWTMCCIGIVGVLAFLTSMIALIWVGVK